MRPLRWRLLGAVILTLVAVIVGNMPPLALKFFVDNTLTPVSKNVENIFSQSKIVLGVLFICFTPLFASAFGNLNRYIISALAQRLVVDIRSSFYSHVLRLDLDYHNKVGPGILMNRLMGDVNIVQNLITGEALSIFASLAGLIFAIACSYVIDWHIATLMVLSLVCCSFSYYHYMGRIRIANIELRDQMDDMSGKLQEKIAGVRLVKNYGRANAETANFLESNLRVQEHGLKSQILSVSLGTYVRIFSGVGSALCASLAIYYVLRGRMSFGDMQALNLFFWFALNPAINLTVVANSVIQAFTSTDRIIDVMGRPINILDRKDAKSLSSSEGHLTLENVDFSYNPKQKLFENFDLEIPAGKMTALVGHTGCGKTTITALLMRLYDIQGGNIRLDGNDVRDLKQSSLRRHIVAVPQESVIFDGTVRENIAYGKAEATMEEVIDAAKAAQIHDAIIKLSDGYNTDIGSTGSQLSVGQKQRIAIARAIILKPSVIIMDEATSSLDSESELAVQKALSTILKNRTSVVVAHRLSTITSADQIVALDKGKIIEVGTHAELMKIEGGYYRTLYDELSGKNNPVKEEATV